MNYMVVSGLGLTKMDVVIIFVFVCVMSLLFHLFKLIFVCYPFFFF
jgi:hypothetical protein